jgi:hypothetical protein
VASYGGWDDRFAIVDVDGETLIVKVDAPAGNLDEFAPVAQKVLDTVDWQNTFQQ